MMNSFRFLDYSNGKWTDISLREVPEYGDDKWYELPRLGTTIKVFEKRVIESGVDYEITERGRKLYDLAWTNGKFHKLAG
jgi:hypothetical protein